MHKPAVTNFTSRCRGAGGGGTTFGFGATGGGTFAGFPLAGDVAGIGGVIGRWTFADAPAASAGVKRIGKGAALYPPSLISDAGGGTAENLPPAG